MKLDNKIIKAVIFDIDGTLLDSCSVWTDVDRRFFEKRDMVMPEDYGDAIGHIGLDKAAVYTIERFNLNENKEDIIKEWKEDVINLYKTSIELKPHAKDFLLLLKENHIPFCAATANDEDCYKSALIRHGIYEMFDFIVEVNHYKDGKDKPTIYYDCAKKLGVEVSNCAVFEDLLMALSTAKKAGFISVGVYDKTNKDESIKEEISDYYIKDFSDIIKLIK